MELLFFILAWAVISFLWNLVHKGRPSAQSFYRRPGWLELLTSEKDRSPRGAAPDSGAPAPGAKTKAAPPVPAPTPPPTVESALPAEPVAAPVRPAPSRPSSSRSIPPLAGAAAQGVVWQTVLRSPRSLNPWRPRRP